MSIRVLPPTNSIPNPLHRYASYTYALSLWWLHKDDITALNKVKDIDQSLQWNPTNKKSFVIAEDSGLYTNRRLPTTLGLNYQLQDVVIQSLIGNNSTTGSTNNLTGNFKIVEPYGVTLIDSLVQASWDGVQYVNYLENIYMLQIDFVGYDDKGQAISAADTAIYRKRFPLRLLTMGVDVNKQGATYSCEFSAWNQTALSNEYAKTNANFNVKAGTVGEFFTNLSLKYSEFFQNQVKTEKAQYADSIVFDIDPDIEKSLIVDKTKVPYSQSNPNSTGFDPSAITWPINHGTDISSLVVQIISASDYLQHQLGLSPNETVADQTQILNTIKITTSTERSGLSMDGTATDNAFDQVRCTYAKRITYSIHQYSTYKGTNPLLPQASDSRPSTVKQYSYLYTGQNIDVLDLKLNFDMAYYTTVLSYASEYAAAQQTADTKNQQLSQYASTLLLTPSTMAIGIPALRGVPVLTPQKIKSVVNDVNLSSGLNMQNNPKNIIALDALKSTYTKAAGDMLTVDLTIAGDPHLLKQDDVYYLPSPNPDKSPIYNSLTQTQYDFAAAYQQLKFDIGEVVVRLAINTPLDIDTDWTNNGLVFPQPGVMPSLFSGQYHVNLIESTFTNGKFEQKLSLYRFPNDDIVDATKQAISARPNPGDNGNNPYGLNINNGVATFSRNTTTLIPGNSTGNGIGTTTEDNTREQ